MNQDEYSSECHVLVCGGQHLFASLNRQRIQEMCDRKNHERELKIIEYRRIVEIIDRIDEEPMCREMLNDSDRLEEYVAYAIVKLNEELGYMVSVDTVWSAYSKLEELNDCRYRIVSCPLI